MIEDDFIPGSPNAIELEKLQIELVKLQKWVQENDKRMAIIFEGRDTAGKGGAILRFTQFLNPRAMRIVALPKPTEVEKGQWYFQRYAKHLPNPGEMVFFDRSWYNRSVVEPVMGFCTPEQYERFMKQVPLFENMLIEDGIILIKFWFSISINEQKHRLEQRKINPLKQWKLSTVDMLAQSKWDEFTRHKEIMFSRTHSENAPWIIIQGNNKPSARIEAIRYVINMVDYDEKGCSGVSLNVNNDILSKFQPT
ncbi:polyphosphate kinase 2 [Chondrinema litorale]|uniref:polyphosphate kinase 2 n=1 Tax=Chondrinema litorale TaxID=2994555 RepID=UPI0025432B5E|nr:polyphosphate kinase 2 [Chondrinema litorale]UZR98619.1 polyphosphate kinase 2 [Chondrinema litorale]